MGNLIPDLAASIVKCQEGMDGRTFWPCHPGQIEAYFSDLIAWELLRKWREDKNKFAKALDKVDVDSLRFHLLSSGIIGLKVLRKYGPGNVTTEEIIAFISTVINSIKKRVQTDPFCQDGENRILTEKDFAKKLKGSVFIPFSDHAQKQILTNFNIMTEALTWALYFDLYRDDGMVIHGGYEIPGGKVIIRDFFDLGPAPKVSTLLLYDKNFDYFFDFANHIVYEGNHLEHLKGYLVLVGGKILMTKDILILEENFSDLRKELVAKINRLSPQETIWQGATHYWRLFKNFFEFYGESYLPPKEVKNRLADWGLRYWDKYKPSAKKVPLSYFQKLYDPNNDFLG